MRHRLPGQEEGGGCEEGCDSQEGELLSPSVKRSNGPGPGHCVRGNRGQTEEQQRQAQQQGRHRQHAGGSRLWLDNGLSRQRAAPPYECRRRSPTRGCALGTQTRGTRPRSQKRGRLLIRACGLGNLRWSPFRLHGSRLRGGPLHRSRLCRRWRRRGLSRWRGRRLGRWIGSQARSRRPCGEAANGWEQAKQDLANRSHRSQHIVNPTDPQILNPHRRRHDGTDRQLPPGVIR